MNLTGGVLNSGDLLKSDNAACLAYEFAAQVKPDLALGLLSTLTGAVGKATSQLSCPQLMAIDDSQLMQFPGYQKSTAAGITK